MSSSLFTLTLIFAALLVIHIVYKVIAKLQPDKDYSGIGTKIKTWWGMLVIFCLATLFNPIVSLISLMVLAFFSLKEYFSMIRNTRKADRRLFYGHISRFRCSFTGYTLDGMACLLSLFRSMYFSSCRCHV